MRAKLDILKAKPIDLVTFGETLIDVICDSNDDTHRLVGGSPSNIAINVHQLGRKAAFVGAIGHDDNATLIVSTFKNYGLDHQFIHHVKEPTTEVHIKQSDGSPTPIFKRGADFFIPYTPHLEALIRSTKIFHFSYWPVSEEPSRTTLLRCLNVAKAEGAMIAFDPNLHPGIQGSNAPSFETLESIFRQVDFIKPSLDDAARLFNVVLTPDEYMDRFEAYEIPLIILSLGKDGVLISDQKKRMTLESRAVSIIDTTGAGDAFYSGFYASLLHGNSIIHAAHDAQSVSAIILNQIGALTVLPPLESITKGV
jgi:fructokinase